MNIYLSQDKNVQMETIQTKVNDADSDLNTNAAAGCIMLDVYKKNLS